MGLTREEELNRTFRIVHYLSKAVKVAEKQMCTLVGCETAGESYCEHIVTESFLDGHNLARRIVVGCSRI